MGALRRWSAGAQVTNTAKTRPKTFLDLTFPELLANPAELFVWSGVLEGIREGADADRAGQAS